MTTKLSSNEKNPMGYSVIMYTKQGGAVSWWNSSLEKALGDIILWKGKPHAGIALVRIPYKNRMRRHVIQRALNLKDAGIFTSRGNCL